MTTPINKLQTNTDTCVCVYIYIIIVIIIIVIIIYTYIPIQSNTWDVCLCQPCVILHQTLCSSFHMLVQASQEWIVTTNMIQYDPTVSVNRVNRRHGTAHLCAVRTWLCQLLVQGCKGAENGWPAEDYDDHDHDPESKISVVSCAFVRLPSSSVQISSPYFTNLRPRAVSKLWSWDDRLR